MHCPACQHVNPAGSTFCLECGAKLALTCPACSTELPRASKFCNKCGARLVGRAEAQPRFASPDSYTPKHLAEKILTSKSALEGERKQVTVLFADLKGSMELLADRDPEEARKLLDPVLKLMMEAVHRYEGTVNQVMGDGIMALFGAPLALEDHPVRACYAALRMQESVKQYGDELRRRQGVPIRIRVGLHSGEVVVRSIGFDLRMDYTAVGQTTHLAARMEQMAHPGSSLLTAATLTLAEGYVRVKALGPLPVRGLEAPIDVFELTGAAAARSRLQAATARGLSRFVGRDTEMEQLGRALKQAQQGRGQVVAVVGELGVGKSRLFHEFVHSHRTTGWLVLETSSVSYGRATSYLPVVDLLKSYFDIEDGDGAQRICEKVTGKMLTLDEQLRETIAPILSLLDAVPADDPFQALGPSVRRGRIMGALKQAAFAREPGAAAVRRLRGLAVARHRESGRARPARREPARQPHPPARQLPAGVRTPLDVQDVLHEPSH
jgi:class 3 adenylate cyclase